MHVMYAKLLSGRIFRAGHASRLCLFLRLSPFVLTGALIVLAATYAIAQQLPAQHDSQPSVADYHLEGAQLQKAEGLYKIRTARYLIGNVYPILLLIGFLAFRVGPRFRDWAEILSRRNPLQAMVFTPLVLLTLGVLMLPFDVHGHYISTNYGMSVQSWGSWFWDWTKGMLLNMAIGSLIVMGLFFAIRRSPRKWWVYAWAVSLPVVLFMIFITPVVIDPIFNHYEPLAARQPHLVQEIEKIVKRGALDIPQSRMFEMRASEKVTTYNAYVTGIGASKRVVVWDTTAKDLQTAETLFIFGHELGHYVLHHIWKGFAFFAVTSIVGFWIGYQLFNFLLARYGTRWGIREAADWASLPVLILAALVLSCVSEPIGAAFSRHLEHQADIYGLEVVHGIVPNSSQAAASSFQKLGEKSYSYPHPNALLVFWDYDHPTIGERVKFAVEYRPWDEGQATKYVNQP
jgi:STE24 endopeptidase